LFRATLCAAVLAVPALSGVPPAREAASANYRLSWFEPAGGEAVMSSSNYRLRAVVAPPLSGPMRSGHFAIRPLLRPPGDAPAGYRVIALR
jgi:hypothetical protein